jgi:hypothetical protein
MWLYFSLLLLLAWVGGCHRTPIVPAGRAPLANVSDPACPDLSGTYPLLGEPLPGMPTYFRKVNSKVTLDRLLGLNWPTEDFAESANVQLVQQDTIVLNGELAGEYVMGQLDLRPGDTVVCSPGEMLIHQQRETRGASFEQLWRITRTERSFKLEQDGTLVVNTSIRASHKSSLLAQEPPAESYGARFRRVK